MDRCAECGYHYDDDTARHAARAIRDGTAEVVAIIEDPSHELRTRRQPQTWSPLEYACHLRDMLLVQRERILTARRTHRPVATPMGRDDRVDHDGYAEQEPADVARQLVDAALMFGNVLNRLDDADWARVLVYPYPEPGAERTLRWVALHSLHEIRHHLLDIRRQV